MSGITVTARQKEILALVCEGLTNREIGSRLWISEKTVKVHLAVIYAKLGVPNRAAAAAWFMLVGRFQ